MNSTGQVTSRPNGETDEYIVPPGLAYDVDEFLNHYKAAGSSPIMVVGPTGVGKSLFLHLFKKLFEEEHLSENPKPPVVWANCSHFGGPNSDPNIARSELFGLEKGIIAKTDRYKKGLVETADGGAMVLEEIGELPQEVQAMLLTFIETGEYRAVGGTETKTAKVRIVGATNREEALRSDFRYRFFPFYLQALHERRQDILYYMYRKFPQVVSTLGKNQVLALLAYNWPGNVREIDRVARLMIRFKTSSDEMKFTSTSEKQRFESRSLHYIDDRYTSLRGELGQQILDKVSNLGGGDIKLLESLLTRFKVGLSDDSSELVFSDVPEFFDFEKRVQWDKREEMRKRFGVDLMPPIKPFEDAFGGYLAFCGLFMQYPVADVNVLEHLNEADPVHLRTKELISSKDDKAKIDRLIKSIMKSIRFIEIDGYEWPEDPWEYWDALGRLIEETENESAWVEADKEYLVDHISGMTRDEVLRLYFEGLLRKTGGNLRKASALAGLPPSTLRDQMNRVGARLRKNSVPPEEGGR